MIIKKFNYKPLQLIYRRNILSLYYIHYQNKRNKYLSKHTNIILQDKLFTLMKDKID